MIRAGHGVALSKVGRSDRPSAASGSKEIPSRSRMDDTAALRRLGSSLDSNTSNKDGSSSSDKSGTSPSADRANLGIPQVIEDAIGSTSEGDSVSAHDAAAYDKAMDWIIQDDPLQLVPGNDSKTADVALGFETLDGYLGKEVREENKV